MPEGSRVVDRRLVDGFVVLCILGSFRIGFCSIFSVSCCANSPFFTLFPLILHMSLKFRTWVRIYATICLGEGFLDGEFGSGVGRNDELSTAILVRWSWCHALNFRRNFQHALDATLTLLAVSLQFHDAFDASVLIFFAISTRSWCYALDFVLAIWRPLWCYALNFLCNFQHALDATLLLFLHALDALCYNIFGQHPKLPFIWALTLYCG